MLSAPTWKELRSHHFHPYKNKQKINDTFEPIRELRLQDKLPPKTWRHSWYLLTWSKSCRSHKLVLETRGELAWKWKTAGMQSFGGGGVHTSVGFTSRNPTRSALWRWRPQKDSPRDHSREGKSNHCKTWNKPRVSFITKAYAPGEKTLPELSPD